MWSRGRPRTYWHSFLRVDNFFGSVWSDECFVLTPKTDAGHCLKVSLLVQVFPDIPGLDVLFVLHSIRRIQQWFRALIAAHCIEDAVDGGLGGVSHVGMDFFAHISLPQVEFIEAGRSWVHEAIGMHRFFDSVLFRAVAACDYSVGTLHFRCICNRSACTLKWPKVFLNN